MAKTFLKLTTILSLLIPLTLHSHMAFSTDADDTEDEEEYVLDAQLPYSKTRSRFLVSVIKKGTHCNPITYNICNGISANKGNGLLYCCKKHCRNVLSDRNNCGKCGHKCMQGERCCDGVCTNVLYNSKHCGTCKKTCSPGVPCENGFCGYA